MKYETNEVDECCSFIGKLNIGNNENAAFSLSNTYGNNNNRNYHPSRNVSEIQNDHSTLNSYLFYHSGVSNSSSSKFFDNYNQSTMTIGHHYHYNTRNHYPYHDHYHDDSPLLPRLEFPSSQFDRLLRGHHHSPESGSTSPRAQRLGPSSRESSSLLSSQNGSNSPSWKNGCKK
ncbi:hypothetical protein SSS_01640 [Sarcoptes scabiei]|nr:hypothetical protein SSS_01640 [Sarcoptes scabiei]